MKIIHAADLHIDSYLHGLASYEGAPLKRLRGATRGAFTNLIDLTIAEDARLLLLAGDVFDGPWRDYNTGLFFARELLRLRESGTVVALVRGNHDAESQVVRGLTLPDHVTTMPWDAPSSLVLEELGVVVHGQSFPSRRVDVDLAAGYPARIEGLVNLGLLHTSADGRPGHQTYAPTSLDVLRSKGYDYWALGHVHAREVLSTSPWIVFPGNLQGRHARETGPKGATVITIDGAAITDVRHAVLDVVRWARIEVDLSGARDVADAIDLAEEPLRAAVDEADGKLLATRVELGGSFAPEILRDPAKIVAEVRSRARDRHGDLVFVEKVKVHPPPVPLGDLGLFDDPLGAEDVVALFAEMEDLKKKLPPELLDDDAIGWSADAVRQCLLASAEALLRARLAGGR